MTFSKRNARRLLCLSAATIAAPPAAAQQTAPGPVITPAPERSPVVTTLPGVTAERFTLGTPTPAPVVVPSPLPSATPTRAAAPTPTPRAPATARAAPTPTPSAQPTPEASPTPAVPLAVPSPQVAPTATATVPAAQPSGQTPGWLWMLAGAGITLFGLAAALLLRRRRAEPEAEEPQRVDLKPPPPAPVPAAPANEPFDVQILPRRIEVNPQHALLEIELQIANFQPGAAENVRIDITMISASPDQDRQLAAYHASRLLPGVVQPFDLGPGAAQGLTATLTLERDQVHVVDVGGRPMFVPLVMIDIRWRSGISLRRFGADFMVGTAGQGNKLGPIWLDRQQQTARFSAMRYLPRAILPE